MRRVGEKLSPLSSYRLFHGLIFYMKLNIILMLCFKKLFELKNFHLPSLKTIIVIREVELQIILISHFERENISKNSHPWFFFAFSLSHWKYFTFVHLIETRNPHTTLSLKSLYVSLQQNIIQRMLWKEIYWVVHLKHTTAIFYGRIYRVIRKEGNILTE